MNQSKNSFSACMKLRGKKSVNLLFQKGKTLYLKPIRFYFLPNQNLKNNQVLIAVPKKYVKQAVQRNTVKRRIREAYRTLKNDVRCHTYYMLAFVYTGKNQSYQSIAHSIAESLQYLQNKRLNHKNS